jgi:hypothetical protein
VEDSLRKMILVGTCLLGACATEPSGPTAEPGTSLWEQQKYLQTLEQCQEAHRWDPSPDAGIGAVPTPDDTKFSACLAQANRDLGLKTGQTDSLDAGPGY